MERENEISSRACLVNWETVCKARQHGDLGVLNLKDMNSALFGKWLWKNF